MSLLVSFQRKQNNRQNIKADNIVANNSISKKYIYNIKRKNIRKTVISAARGWGSLHYQGFFLTKA